MLRSALSAIVLATASAVVCAQAFPSKPIRFVVPYGPGGAINMVTRLVGAKVSEELGQPVVVDNRGGAAGRIGAEYVARSAPDGYTIMNIFGPDHILSGFVFKNMPYHPVKDFTPIGSLVEPVLVVAGTASLPANSLRDFIASARKEPPGALGYGTTSTLTNLAMAQLALLSGVQMVNVPYKGNEQLITDLMGGHLKLSANSLTAVWPSVQAGKAKVLAALMPRRIASLPDVPTVTEVLPEYEAFPGGNWVYGPANMPPALVHRLNVSMVKGLRSPDVRGKIESSGLVLVANSPEELGQLIRRTESLAARLVKVAGIRPE